MKKLLVLLLVFGMATTANAAIVSFSADAYTPGGTINITMSSDEVIVAASLALIHDNGFGGTAVVGSWDAKFVTFDNGYNGGPFGYGIGDLIMASGAITPGLPATGLLYTYTYDVPSTASGVITFSIYDLAAMGTTSSITYMDGEVATELLLDGMEFTSVPEPMTIVLLGLGGLFLRRRK